PVRGGGQGADRSWQFAGADHRAALRHRAHPSGLFSQIRALTAQSRMSGMVVGLLPVVVLAMFGIVQPSYTEMLLFDHTGKLILKTAMGLDLGAFLLIRRILKVRF